MVSASAYDSSSCLVHVLDLVSLRGDLCLPLVSDYIIGLCKPKRPILPQVTFCHFFKGTKTKPNHEPSAHFYHQVVFLKWCVAKETSELNHTFDQMSNRCLQNTLPNTQRKHSSQYYTKPSTGVCPSLCPTDRESILPSGILSLQQVSAQQTEKVFFSVVY